MELDNGLVTILCRGFKQCELPGVVKGIPLKFRVSLGRTVFYFIIS